MKGIDEIDEYLQDKYSDVMKKRMVKKYGD
jgi:hypothetical protein